VADERFDVAVVGSGPGGAVAALVLARGGARVALIDKAAFPRDKACGDVIGPRGVRALEDLGLGTGAEPGTGAGPGMRVGDMIVVGPSGRRVRLPCFEGRTYPGFGTVEPRLGFDARLARAAQEAGAIGVTGRVARLLDGSDAGGEGVGGLGGVELDDGRRVRAPVVIGADGATSAVAEAAGLVDARRVLWGFAVRVYIAQPVALPHIVLWEPEARRPFPGYGWLFPGPGGTANAGLGIGTLADRRGGAGAVRRLPDFLDYLRRAGLLGGSAGDESGRLGGWLKMGLVGTTPASGGVLLVGDAAGLVNPLQGEGIAQAMTSGRLAAQAVLAGPGTAAARYRAELGRAHLPYYRVAGAAHAALVGRPAATAVVGRALTLPGVGRALAGGWGLYWNELLDGAAPGPARATAAVASALGGAALARSPVRTWLDRAWGGAPAGP
jgi:geranylgeranyl reductase family protein